MNIINIKFTSITIIHAVNQSTDFIEPFHNIATIIELNEIPPKNEGLDTTRTFEYLRLLYLRCTLIKCNVKLFLLKVRNLLIFIL